MVFGKADWRVHGTDTNPCEILISVSNRIITANGNNGSGGNDRIGGGSGGSIYLTAGTLAGNGTISANRGVGSSGFGPGGGGRVALYCSAGVSWRGSALATAVATAKEYEESENKRREPSYFLYRYKASNR